MNIYVDKSWFDKQFEKKGLSLRGVAKAMNVEPSALSRTLNGTRKMTVAEVAKIATVLDVPQNEVLSHVTDSARRVSDSGEASAGRRQHPLFGRLKGVLTIPPGVDLTQPADPELADYLDRKYGTGPQEPK